MGVRDEMLSDLNAAFDGDLADAVSSFTIKQISRSDSTFNPATGINTPTETTSTIRGIFSGVTIKDVEILGAEPKTSKLIVLSSEFSTNSLEVGDTVVNAANESYTVYEDKIDPMTVAHVYFIKRSI